MSQCGRAFNGNVAAAVDTKSERRARTANTQRTRIKYWHTQTHTTEVSQYHIRNNFRMIQGALRIPGRLVLASRSAQGTCEQHTQIHRGKNEPCGKCALAEPGLFNECRSTLGGLASAHKRALANGVTTARCIDPRLGNMALDHTETNARKRQPMRRIAALTYLCFV